MNWKGRHFGVRAVMTLAALALSLMGCQAAGEGSAGQGDLLTAIERKWGLIAYVGNDGNIYTINQGGGKMTAITTDAVPPAGEEDAPFLTYAFPTWTIGGRTLAFAGIRGTGSTPEGGSLHRAAADGDKLEELFSSEAVRPIYLYWSPDDELLSFLTTAPGGGLLLQTAGAEDEDALVVDAGQPLFWDWAPRGERLLIHASGGTAGERISFLAPQDVGFEEGLSLEAGSFQAPAWSPDGKRILLSRRSQAGENELVLLDETGAEVESLATVGDRPVSFAWSPDGDKVAYIAGSEGLGVLGTLTVLDIKGRQDPIIVEEQQTLGFFWSPNSKRLAYFEPRRVTPSSESGGEQAAQPILVLGLSVMDVGSGVSELIQVFQPTAEFFGILPYFDQYHRSATIWSPDSRNLVISALIGEGVPRVMVVNAAGELDPRDIAGGTLAFWSWR